MKQITIDGQTYDLVPRLTFKVGDMVRLTCDNVPLKKGDVARITQIDTSDPADRPYRVNKEGALKWVEVGDIEAITPTAPELYKVGDQLRMLENDFPFSRGDVVTIDNVDKHDKDITYHAHSGGRSGWVWTRRVEFYSGPKVGDEFTIRVRVERIATNNGDHPYYVSVIGDPSAAWNYLHKDTLTKG